MGASLFSLENLSFDYGSHCVFNAINLKINAGEFCALIGPNGSGKSTLLKLLSGELIPTSGKLKFKDNALSRWPRDQLAKQLAVLPQQSLLNFPYTLKEVVDLGRYPHASGAQGDEQILQKVLTAMDLHSLQTHIYTQVSGGEKQRTQLARVLTQIWPDEGQSGNTLLLDEPVSALDRGHAERLMQELKQLCRQGLGIVVALHDINMAARYCNRMIALKEGEIIAEGSAQAVMQSTILNSLFNTDGMVIQHPEKNYPVYL